MTNLNSYFLRASDVCKLLDVKPTKAYSIIRTINKSLESKGIATISGRVSRSALYAAYGISDNLE